MRSGTSSRAMRMPRAPAALRTATASSGGRARREGGLAGRRGRAAPCRMPAAGRRRAPRHRKSTRAGQQQLQQVAVVDGLAPGAQETRLEPAPACGLPDRGGRGRHVEQRHVVEAASGHVERVHAAISRAAARSRSSARARQCSISRRIPRRRGRGHAEQESELEADQPDGRVVALRHAFGDGLPQAVCRARATPEGLQAPGSTMSSAVR